MDPDWRCFLMTSPTASAQKIPGVCNRIDWHFHDITLATCQTQEQEVGDCTIGIDKAIIWHCSDFWSRKPFYNLVHASRSLMAPNIATSYPRVLCNIIPIRYLESMAMMESPWHHKPVVFVNIVSLPSLSIRRHQWRYRLYYYGVVFAHLVTGCGINVKGPSGLDSDRWIPHAMC